MDHEHIPDHDHRPRPWTTPMDHDHDLDHHDHDRGPGTRTRPRTTTMTRTTPREPSLWMVPDHVDGVVGSHRLQFAAHKVLEELASRLSSTHHDEFFTPSTALPPLLQIFSSSQTNRSTLSRSPMAVTVDGADLWSDVFFSFFTNNRSTLRVRR
jgi:hypothetical protein